MATFDLESYATVQERIGQFYQDFPDGSIRTFLVLRDGPEVIFEARVYRNPEEAAMGIYTSGFAREIEGKSPVNKTSHLENCESSAVGRALANLGYATDARRPSRSEMLKVARMRDEHEEMLQYIRTVGPKVNDDATLEVGGNTYNLKEFVRKNWATIKEQFRIARTVVEAMEAAVPAEPTGGGVEERAAGPHPSSSADPQETREIDEWLQMAQGLALRTDQRGDATPAQIERIKECAAELYGEGTWRYEQMETVAIHPGLTRAQAGLLVGKGKELVARAQPAPA